MICVLADLIADLAIHFERFPIEAGQMQRADYLELGPGGSTNVAITLARLGQPVECLGELGDDRFGHLVLDGLRTEGIRVNRILVTSGASTPVAGVLVDQAGEPAYVGYRGTLQHKHLQQPWQEAIRSAAALFVDGWADQEWVAGLVLEGLRLARDSGVPTYFDPGPGNPAFDLEWHRQAAQMVTGLLLTEQEAERLAGSPAAVSELLRAGPELVVVKRGAGGCTAYSGDRTVSHSGFAVEAVDLTGAGDSFDAAVIYGHLAGWELEELVALANATGAAKVRKRGTGHNMPTLDEIKAVLRDASEPALTLLN